MSRIFFVKEANDCDIINALLDKLDRDKVDYEIDYESEEGIQGFLIMVDWEED